MNARGQYGQQPSWMLMGAMPSDEKKWPWWSVPALVALAGVGTYIVYDFVWDPQMKRWEKEQRSRKL
jgi:hypothetical protein